MTNLLVKSVRFYDASWQPEFFRKFEVPRGSQEGRKTSCFLVFSWVESRKTSCFLAFSWVEGRKTSCFHVFTWVEGRKTSCFHVFAWVEGRKTSCFHVFLRVEGRRSSCFLVFSWVEGFRVEGLGFIGSTPIRILIILTHHSRTVLPFLV